MRRGSSRAKTREAPGVYQVQVVLAQGLETGKWRGWEDWVGTGTNSRCASVLTLFRWSAVREGARYSILLPRLEVAHRKSRLVVFIHHGRKGLIFRFQVRRLGSIFTFSPQAGGSRTPDDPISPISRVFN